MKHVLIICLAISAFIGVSLASTTVLPSATALNLQNSTSISQGQATAFLNGTIKFTNVTTIYKPPSVGNIKKLSSSTWGVITFVDVISTYPNNVPLSDIYFKALTNNPSNIEIYELNTTSQIVDEANTFITGTKLISTDNGTLSQNIYNTITTPTQVNTSVWENLSDSNVIIKPGINEFEITGSGNAGTTYDWEYSISTANLISPVAAIGSGLKLKNAPVTSISFDPTWTVPSSVIAWFNYTVVNNDGTNSIPVGSTLNITVNAVQYSAYANNAFTNWVVFNGYTGNILYSWMQGNVANGIQTSGLNTISFGVSANAPNDIIANGLLFDINTDFSVAAGATDNNAFALGFYSMATNSMNGNNIGEAPQLTCANGANLGTCGTYGKYDDGANVFDVFYSNF